MLQALDRVALAAFTGMTAGLQAYLGEAGREGVFEWSDGNASANIAADPFQGVYVPPISDPTGGTGAWVRIVQGGYAFATWFGATGGPSIDATAIINSALALDIVKVLQLGPLWHYHSEDISKPSGKALIGVGRSQTWFKRIPQAPNTQRSSPALNIFCAHDENGYFADFSIDVQRSGLGIGATPELQALNRCNGLVFQGDCYGTFAERIDVYNATGYAQYESNSGPEIMRNVIRKNCAAYNSQIGFETTGNISAKQIDCNVYAGPDSVFDGGVVINMEAMFHIYGAVLKCERIRCTGRGPAGSGDLTVTTGSDVGTVIMQDCDIEVTGIGAALYVEGQDGNRVKDYQVLDGRFHCAGGNAAIFLNTTAQIRGGSFRGKNGGIYASTGSEIDFYDVETTGWTEAGGLQATGITVAPTATARWHGGGQIISEGPDNLCVPVVGILKYIHEPLQLPPSKSTAALNVRIRKHLYGEVAGTALGSYQPTATNRKYHFNVSLNGFVLSRARTQVRLSLRQPDGSLTWPPHDLAFAWNWQASNLIQVQISTATDLSTWFVNYEIIEYMAP